MGKWGWIEKARGREGRARAGGWLLGGLSPPRESGRGTETEKAIEVGRWVRGQWARAWCIGWWRRAGSALGRGEAREGRTKAGSGGTGGRGGGGRGGREGGRGGREGGGEGYGRGREREREGGSAESYGGRGGFPKLEAQLLSLLKFQQAACVYGSLGIVRAPEYNKRATGVVRSRT